MITKILPIALLAGVLVAGCGSGSGPGTPNTTPTPQPAAGPKTLNGKAGDTLALDGSGFNKDLNDHTKTKVKVTLKGTRGPIKGFDIPSNRKLIGVVLRVSNVGELVYDDPVPDGVLKLAGGREGKQTSLIPIGRSNPCANPSLKLRKGQSRSVCIAYEVPKHAAPQTFEYASDSGYGDRGRWAL